MSIDDSVVGSQQHLNSSDKNISTDVAGQSGIREDRQIEVDLDVYWDEPIDQDPANPMNWSSTRKWIIVATVSFITFLT